MLAAVSVLAVAGIPAAAHHSNPFYFEMDQAMTLEGEVLDVKWINPHILLFLQSKNARGEWERWVIQGASLNNAMRQAGLKERLQSGVSISARVLPPRRPLVLNDAQTVLPARPDDAGQTSRIVGGGQIRFANGDVLAFGSGGPRF